MDANNFFSAAEFPHSIEAEQSVIGSMIMDRDAIVVASELISGEDFYNKHRDIFEDASKVFAFYLFMTNNMKEIYLLWKSMLMLERRQRLLL